MQKADTRRWITELTNVDIETGEMLADKRKLIEKNYYLVKTIKNYHENEKNRIIRVTNEWRKSQQLTIEFQ